MSVHIISMACYTGEKLAGSWVGLGSMEFVLVDGKHIKSSILKKTLQGMWVGLECRGLTGGAGARGWESMGSRVGLFCLSVERRGIWGCGPEQGEGGQSKGHGLAS